MDGGQNRGPQPADRRVAGRVEPTVRQPEEPQPVVKEEPKVVYRTEAPVSPSSEAPKRSRQKIIVPIIAIILVLGIAIFGWMTWMNSSQNNATAIDSSKYQAVFFTNGQVYFGKLKAFNNDYLKMTDIYYLQTQAADATTSKNPQQTTTDPNNVQLIKLGSEIHGPEDQMVIAKDQVLFYENLKVDGKVAQSIANYKTTNK